MGTTEALNPFIAVRYDWQAEEIESLFSLPLHELLYSSQQVHRFHHKAGEIQLASLLSIKTGNCPEDCAYCPQSVHYQKAAKTDPLPLMELDTVLQAAKKAKSDGATRFCMGGAWKNVPKGRRFNKILDMVRAVSDLGMETCVTLGMLDKEQAEALASAGLKAYNHNLDTSPEFYKQIITTRSFNERLSTIKSVQEAGIEVCSGGIIGMGESWFDRARMLEILASQKPHPQSVPINVLVPVSGTPLEAAPPIPKFDLVRMIAVTRHVMPKSVVRLSAGREGLSEETQFLCFLAGANSVFYGGKLLTTPNCAESADHALFNATGYQAKPAVEMQQNASSMDKELDSVSQSYTL